MPAGPARHCPAKLLVTPVVTLTVSELGGGDALGDAWSGAGPLAGCMVEATGPVDKTRVDCWVGLFAVRAFRFPPSRSGV